MGPKGSEAAHCVGEEIRLINGNVLSTLYVNTFPTLYIYTYYIILYQYVKFINRGLSRAFARENSGSTSTLSATFFCRKNSVPSLRCGVTWPPDLLTRTRRSCQATSTMLQMFQMLQIFHEYLLKSI